MARFDRLTVYNHMIGGGIVPLFNHADAEISAQIAGALHAGGSRILEFTNRGDFAVEVFAELVKRCRSQYPDLIVGVGTVDDAATAALYVGLGANFVVGPTLVPEVARLCNRRKIAYIPGCATVNEIATAEEWGAEIVKLFPGKAAGGPEFVKALLGPRPWTSIMPSGGVGLDEGNLRTWFDAGVVCVGLGSNLIRSDWIAAGDYGAVAEETRAVLARIAAIRAQRV
jgi:2-dehydro-3-deoxyphosphogluconate aldolase/(4S)-4-hydroxy-2-oxoglutarate aldolase